VEVQLHDLERRLASRRLSLIVTDAAKDWLARAGYDPAYGARPLKRLIQRTIGDQLALALLEGKYTDGDTVTVDIAGPGAHGSAETSHALVAVARGVLDEEGAPGGGLVLR
jgi:ATP-dependent Clp protease ATP-binding subunit ClpB